MASGWNPMETFLSHVKNGQCHVEGGKWPVTRQQAIGSKVTSVSRVHEICREYDCQSNDLWSDDNKVRSPL